MLQEAKKNTDRNTVIERARQRDADALDALVDEYAPRVRGFLRRIVRSGDIDDMMQEVFLRVVRTIGRYQETGRFDAWIFQIARNIAYDYLRDTVRRHTNHDRPGEPDRMAQLPAAESTLGQDLEQGDSASQIEGALRRLPDAEREVILLRHFGQLTFEEIAAVMDTPLGTALARSHRGLGKLRQWVEESA